MIPSLVCSLYYAEGDMTAFISSIGITLICGILLRYKTRFSRDLGIRDGFFIVTVGWILAGVFGALPFLLHGAVDTFIDGFFEAISGFTTTRCNCHTQCGGTSPWDTFLEKFYPLDGGYGNNCIVFSDFAWSGSRGLSHVSSRSSGFLQCSSFRSRLAHTAKTLWFIYLFLRAIMTLLLMFSGLNLFDSLTHTFGTVATGGYSTKNLVWELLIIL